MSRREDIDTAIWDDPDFRQLSADAKFVYIWSFTNGCGMAGVYKLDRARITFDTAIPPARAEKALAELAEGRYLVLVGPWVWVRTRVKRLRTRSEQMAWSVCSDLEQLPAAHPLRAAFVGEYLTYWWLVEKGGERWQALCDATVLTAQGSPEPKPPTLTRPSPEPGATPKGNGKGSGNTDTTTETEGLDAPEAIFEHWRQALSPQARFTRGRREKVRARLRNYEPERIIRAIDGCAASDFHVANGHVDLELICRSDEKLERFESLPLRPEGVRGRDGTEVRGAGLLSHRAVCRACPEPITNEQANNQSGMCDEHYDEHMARLTGEASA